MTLTNLLRTVLIACLLLISGCGDGKKTDGDPKSAGLEALESGRYMKAVGIFKGALVDNPSDRDLLYNLGISYKKLDMFDSALVYLQRGRLFYIRDRGINKELADLCPIYGDFQCAIDAIAALIETGDNEKMYWARLAELYYRNKDKLMAVKYYKLLLHEFPDRKNYYIYLSGSLSELFRYEESNNFLNQCLDKFGPAPEVYANLGTNFLSLKQFDKAEQAYRGSLALNPENVPIWINLAHMLTIGDDRVRKTEALEIYKKYINQTPKFYNLDSIIPALEAELSP